EAGAGFLPSPPKRGRGEHLPQLPFLARSLTGTTYRSRPPLPPGRSEAKYSIVPSRLSDGERSPVGASLLLRSFRGSGLRQRLGPVAVQWNRPVRPLSSGPSRYIVLPSGVSVTCWKSGGRSLSSTGSPNCPPLLGRVATKTRQPSLVLRLK